MIALKKIRDKEMDVSDGHYDYTLRVSLNGKEGTGASRSSFFGCIIISNSGIVLVLTKKVTL
ncbi:MAG: hypothetical protein Q4F05_17885 [bacterium]|nr:hypothetical protein [bacterium]